MLHTYAQNQLTGLLDRGILDPKTRYLLLVGLYMMNNHWDGVLPQACNAKAAGATDEELMEVAFCVLLLGGQSQAAGERRLPRRRLQEPDLPGDQPSKEVAGPRLTVPRFRLPRRLGQAPRWSFRPAGRRSLRLGVFMRKSRGSPIGGVATRGPGNAADSPSWRLRDSSVAAVVAAGDVDDHVPAIHRASPSHFSTWMRQELAAMA